MVGDSYGNTSLTLDLLPASNVSADGEQLYLMPSALVAFFILLYVLVILIGAFGNALTIYVIISSRRMKTVPNLYILNLALADFLVSVFALPFQFQAVLAQRWDMAPFLCDFSPVIVNLSVNVSVLTLTCISLDRYQAVLNPLTHKPSKVYTKIILIGIWTVSMAIALPHYRFYEFNTVSMDNETKPFCSVPQEEFGLFQVYNIVLTVVDYIIPILFMSVCYARITISLWCATVPGAPIEFRDGKIVQNKKRIVQMLMVVVILFCICWFPYHLYFLLNIFNINKFKYIQIIFIICHWLAMSNSCYNPIIYAIFCSKFRTEYIKVLKMDRCTRDQSEERTLTVQTNLTDPSPNSHQNHLAMVNLKKKKPPEDDNCPQQELAGNAECGEQLLPPADQLSTN